MELDIILYLLAGLISLSAGAVLPLINSLIRPHLQRVKARNPNSNFAERLSKILSIKPDEPKIPYRERISRTLEALKKASDEIDTANAEFNSIMKDKQATIDGLEGKLMELSSKETELTSKIETLQKVPIEALTYFENILNRGEKRSKYRDYILFGIGVVVSVIVTIILKKFGY